VNARKHKYEGAWCQLVKFAMARAGMSQQRLAAETGEALSNINQWVNGKAKPPIDRLEIFDVPLRFTAQEREQSRWYALEAYCHEEVWKRLQELERLVAAGESERDALAAELARLRDQLGGLAASGA
jgi:transcriptional regulator with XRE-family HTH domain